MRISHIKRAVAVALFFGATALFVTACSETYPELSSLRPAQKKFSATLVGTNEVPAVTTTAAGVMNLTQEDSVSILYTISTTAATDSITMAHIHAGAAGVAGPIMVWFFPTELSRAPGAGTAAGINGVIRVGRFTKSGTFFVAPYTWDSLLVRMNAGTAYANVHTKKNGSGEIRGQVTAAVQ
jgi:CHRD domain